VTYRISKRMEFSASHVLSGLPAEHKCGRLHGHNYAVEIEIEAEQLDDTGFVLDYGHLSHVKKWIDQNLDHRHLNEVMPRRVSPTAEHLARWIHEETLEILTARSLLDRGDISESPPISVSAVRVYETPKTCAEYRPTVAR